MPLRHLWGRLNGLAKVLASALVVIPFDLVTVPHSAKDQIPSGEGFGRLFASAQRFGAQHFRLDRAGDAIDNLVLDLKQVSYVAVITVGPEVVTSLRLDQLGGHPDSASHPAQASLENVANAKLASNLPNGRGASLVREAGISGDHEKPAKLCQRRY